MNTQFQSILSKKLAKGNKANGFTLIELMVVVAIVGILSGVGLPQLLKAQTKAKDSVAIATLTNAAKECSMILVTEGAGTSFTAADKLKYAIGPADSKSELGGACAVSDSMTLQSQGDTTATGLATVAFDAGGIPGVATFLAR